MVAARSRFLRVGVVGAAVCALVSACGTTSPPSSAGVGAVAGDGGGLADAAATGKGAGSLNVTECDPRNGWQSAVRSATGVKDPATLAGFAAALRDADYKAAFHPGSAAKAGADAGGADASGKADSAGEAPAPDASADPPTLDATSGNDATDAAAADAGSPPLKGDPRVYAAGLDLRSDAVFLMASGELLVASACPLDRLGQVRRLDYALAAAARILTAVDHPGDWKLETQRWTRPDAFYGNPAGTYVRHYLGDATDLQKPLQGAISLAATPLGLAFGIYGHADAPSKVGDVVRMNLLTVAGKKLATGETWPVHDVAALVWDLADAVAAGELPFTADLLVADASVEWNVGMYRSFFEALFAKPGAGMGVSLQGALPGTLRVSRDVKELDLPAAPTGT